MSEIKANSIIECQNSICNQKVRLYHDYSGSLKNFRCGACMPSFQFHAENPKKGQYTLCVRCGSQFRYFGGIKKCHIC